MTKMPTKSTKSAKPAKATTPKSPAAPPTGEQLMRDLQKTLGKQTFANIAEVNAFMQNLMGQGGQVLGGQPLGEPGGPESLKDEAQDLAFEAMEAATAAKARSLAKKALAKDPDCVDALVVLAGIEADSPQKMIGALQEAVAAGERSLGAKFIKENKGHFWLILETRPYMRALEHLAGVYRAEGLNKAAIAIYEKMLALNPNDNQGVRDPLLGLYLALGGTNDAGKLLEAYKDDSMANSAWGRVLERFLSHDLPGAAAALKIARKQNRFVELFLSGQKKLPRQMPGGYSPGSEEEAILCLDNLALAWGNFKSASFWVMEQLAKEAVAKKSPAAKLKIVPPKPGKKRNDQ
jgi:tetratricopeptide (TPR) repeat protein